MCTKTPTAYTLQSNVPSSNAMINGLIIQPACVAVGTRAPNPQYATYCSCCGQPTSLAAKSIVAQTNEQFYAWQCPDCNRYHCKKFPDEGCATCKGENINRRIQESFKHVDTIT